ncbi:MAG: penicillin-binding protein 2 [Thermoanaerobaculia bacterium]|nr:penicillin-binding protein 2 [Thermoanaerobaculia bacterium]
MAVVDAQERRRRLVVRTWQLAAVAGFLFGVVLIGYWWAQVVRGSYYRELAENNRLREEPIQGPRGLILDRRGRPLVENVPSYHLLIDRSRTADLGASVHFLAGILGQSPEEVEARLASYSGVPSFRPVLMGEDLTLEQVAAVEAQNLEHPELEIQVLQRRFYRHGNQIAHVMGYLGEASEDDLARRSGLRRGDLLGVKGVERTYDSLVRGVDGERVVVVDHRGKLIREQGRVAARPGRDLQLTLDLDLQQEAERFFEGKVGSAVAMDPRTGEILAMVSSPSYNPNAFARRLDSSEWRAIVDDEHKPLQNRAIQNAYPPGSVFKIVTAVAALEEGIVSPDDTVFCGGAARIYNHRFRCWKRGGHGSVNLRQALQHSCDVFFYHLGPKLKIDRIAEWARRMGLGRATGIDLAGEKSGLVPDLQWSLRVRKTIWYPGETVSVSIGQGPLLVTPLQVAVLLAAVANGGEIVTPHLVKDLAPPAEARHLHLGEATLTEVRRALQAVVDGGGTGKAARVEGLTVAGKTGTAQVIHQETHIDSADLPYRFRDHAWFASFAPVEEAELVVVVFVEHGGHGSSAAAPLAKLLYERHFRPLPVDRDT